jgi:hypothetical protein
MPAGRYGFKPTPAQMSFGDVIAHMAAGNDALCSSIGGLAAPKRSEVGAGAPKEKLVARLRETFQFCESALAKVNDSRLGGKVPYFGDREISRAEAMVAAAEAPPGSVRDGATQGRAAEATRSPGASATAAFAWPASGCCGGC